MGFGPAGCRDDDHVGLGGDLLQRGLAGGEIHRFFRSVGINHLHAETEVTAPRDGLADAPHADDADGATSQVKAQQLGRMPALPLAGADHAFAFAGAAGGHQHQGHRNIGGGVGHGAGRVGHGDAMATAGIDVDMIVAHTEIRDHPAARAAEILQGFRGDGIAQRDHHPVIERKGRAQFAL